MDQQNMFCRVYLSLCYVSVCVPVCAYLCVSMCLRACVCLRPGVYVCVYVCVSPRPFGPQVMAGALWCARRHLALDNNQVRQSLWVGRQMPFYKVVIT